MEYSQMDLSRLKRIIKPVLTLAVTALVMLAIAPGLLAHDDSMPGNGRVPAHARDTMRAYAAEHHHDEHLSAQSIGQFRYAGRQNSTFQFFFRVGHV